VITVLVVDDDDNVRFTVRVALEGAPPPEGEPMAVIEATNGVQALSMLQSEDIDVVLLDVMMPSLDGFAVLQLLRSGDDPDVGVIMLTARNREADLANAYRAGADAYLTKPFEVDELAELTRLIAVSSPAERRQRRREELQRAELLLQLEHNFRDPAPE
jgi:DNA-binding response OmpR family regulator